MISNSFNFWHNNFMMRLLINKQIDKNDIKFHFISMINNESIKHLIDHSMGFHVSEVAVLELDSFLEQQPRTKCKGK